MQFCIFGKRLIQNRPRPGQPLITRSVSNAPPPICALGRKRLVRVPSGGVFWGRSLSISRSTLQFFQDLSHLLKLCRHISNTRLYLQLREGLFCLAGGCGDILYLNGRKTRPERGEPHHCHQCSEKKRKTKRERLAMLFRLLLQFFKMAAHNALLPVLREEGVPSAATRTSPVYRQIRTSASGIIVARE